MSRLIVSQILSTVVPLALVCSAAVEAAGQEIAHTSQPIRIRQVYVPADDADSWPAGDWIPISREQLRSLFGHLQSEDPQAAYLNQVTYRARLEGTELVGGTIQARARLRGAQSQFIDLGTPSMVMSDFRWPDSRAVWGVDDSGRTLLRIDGDDQTLTGHWSAVGRRGIGTIDFDLMLLPATVSQLQLELPSGQQLRAEEGIVAQVTAGAKPGWQQWTIDLGGRTSCRLSVTRLSSGTASAEQTELQASQVTTCTYLEDGVRLQSDITIQSVAGELEALEITVPDGMTFSPVTIENETVLPSMRRQEEGHTVLSIDVRGVPLTRGSRLRLRGRAPLRTGVQQELPRLGLVGGRWLQVRRQVRVASPLQLKNIDNADSLLVNSSVGIDTGAAMDFDDLSGASQITLTVDTPLPDLSATVLARVEWDQTDPLLQATLNFVAQSGSTYTLTCDVPPEWEVTRVESGSATPVAQWQTAWDSTRGRGVLNVELRNALSAQNPARIVVVARPRVTRITDRVAMPVVLPVVSGEQDVVVVVSPPAGLRFEPMSQSDYRVVELTDLIAERPEWGETFTGSDSRELLVLQATDPAEEQQLVALPIDADRTVDRLLPTTSGERGLPGPSLVPGQDLVRRRSFRGALVVQTVVAVERGGLCRNRATLHIPALTPSQTLVLRLPETARLLSAVSPFPQQVVDSEITIRVSSSAEPSEIVLEYESPLSPSLLSGQTEIPLPKWQGGASTIRWEIEIPGEYRVCEPTEGSSVMAVPGLSWSQRLLGPLGRSREEGLFWPFSFESWRSLMTDDAPAETSTERPLWMTRSVAGDQDSLTLSYWNVRVARRLGWIVLVMSLMLTLWPFQQERLLRPAWSLKMAGVGTAAALLSPELLAIPWGGFVVGATLGALLPEGWRRPAVRRATSGKSPPSTRVVLPLSATLGVALLALLLDPLVCRGWQNSRDTSPAVESSSPTAASQRTLDVLIPLDVEEMATDTELPAFVYVDRAAAREMLGARLPITPRYLLQSADYDIRNILQTRPSLSARFDVVLLQPHQPTRVALHLTEVQFSEADTCLVDGVPVPLLPRRGGAGVVVVVPPMTYADVPSDGTEAADQTDTSESDEAESLEEGPSSSSGGEAPSGDREDPDEVRIVEIEMTFQPRPAQIADRPKLDVGIPPIIDTHATFHRESSTSAEIRVVHDGALTRLPEEGGWQVALGGQGRLTADPLMSESSARSTVRPAPSSDDPIVLKQWQKPVETASVIEVHPMRLRIESRLTFQARPQWAALDGRSLQLQLPERSIVRSVRAVGLQRTQIHTNSGQPVLLDLEFGDDLAADLVVDLSFDLPSAATEGNLTIGVPAMPFLRDASEALFPVHRVGIAAAAGFRLVSADPEGMMPGMTGIDESRLPPWRGTRTSRTAEATFQLSAPRELTIPLELITPQTFSTVRQTMTVKSTVVDWSATIELNVRDASVALHQLSIDPRVNIRQASVLQDSVERLASWSRTAPGDVVLFLKEELGGTQTIQLKGFVDVEDRRDFEIPQLSLESASLAEPAEIVIQHDSDVDISIVADDGTIVVPGESSVSGETIAQLATLNLDPTLPPLRIRSGHSQSPPRLEQVTVVESIDQGQVVWSRLVRIDVSESDQDAITVQLSPRPAQLQFAASVPFVEEPSDGGTTYQLQLSEEDPDVVDITLFGRTPVASEEFPTIRVGETLLQRDLVVILEGTGIELETPGRDVSQTELSPWSRETLAAIQQPLTQILEVDAPPVLVLADTGVGARVQWQRFDSAVWQQRGGHLHGVSVAIILSPRESPIEFVLPQGSRLRSVELDGEEVIAGDVSGRVTIQLAGTTSAQRLILWWSHDGSAEGEFSVPAPVEPTGVSTTLVLLGGDQQYYEFGESVELIPLDALLAEVTLGGGSGRVDSPVVRALQDAGVSETWAEESASRAGVWAVRLQNPPVVSVRVIDRQLIHLLALIVFAAVALVLWYVIGRWSESISRAAVATSGLPALIGLAVLVWLLGWSGLGLTAVVILCGLWMLSLRRSRLESDDRSHLRVAH